MDRPDLSDKAYDALKDAIMSGALPPGSPLLITDLASRLQVSRTPAKEALNRLAQQGLVEDIPKKGYFVTKLDAQDIAELMDANLVVQLGAVERGINLINEAELQEMQRLLDDIDRLVDSEGHCQDYSEFIRLDRELHLLVVGSARNRRLVDFFRSLNTHAHVWRIHHADSLRDKTVVRVSREHRAVVNAFVSRDLAALKSALTEHIQESTRSLVSASAGRLRTAR